MVWIIYAVAAAIMLIAGVVGSLIVKSEGGIEKMPEFVQNHLPLIENLGVAVGLTLALAGLALAFRKLGRVERIMSGRTASGRVRRSRTSVTRRMQKEEPEEAEEVEEAESVDDTALPGLG
jgi:hypothetical protein